MNYNDELNWKRNPQKIPDAIIKSGHQGTHTECGTISILTSVMINKNHSENETNKLPVTEILEN